MRRRQIIGLVAGAAASSVSSSTSVLILKLSTCSLLVMVDCTATEAFDGSENVIGGFGPSERLWISVPNVDVSVNRALEFGR